MRLLIGWGTMLIVGTDLFVLAPLLPSIADSYQISLPLAGLGVAVFAISYMVGAPVLGHLADRIGRRRVLTCCLFAFGVANLLTASASNFTWLLAARMSAGVAAAGVSPSLYALAYTFAPPRRRGIWLAVVVSGLLASLVFGAPIGGLVGAILGWRSVFACLAAFSLQLAWVNGRIWSEDRATSYCAMQPNAPTIAILAPRLAPTVAWSTALYGVYTYLGAGLASYGLSPEQIAEVILAYGCGAIGGMLISGWAADRIRVKQAIELGLFGLSVCMLLIRLALDAGILIGFAFGLASMVAQIFFLAQQAALSEDFPTHRTTALAWNNSALFLGISLGSSVGGQAILLGGFEANLTISAAIALVGWGISKAIGSGSTWLRPRTAAKRGLAATATKPRPDASVT